jgi:hypothetical protein
MKIPRGLVRSGVRKANPGGFRRILAASEKGAAPFRRTELPPEQVEQRRRTARELNLGQYLWPGWHGRRWTDQEISLLGKVPDWVVARRTGWPPDAVGRKRRALGILRLRRRR